MLTANFEVESCGEKDTVVIKPVSPYSTTKKKQKANQSKEVFIQFFNEKEFHELKNLEKTVRSSQLVEQFKKAKEDQRRQTLLRFIRLIATHRVSTGVSIDRHEGFGK